MCVLFEHFVIHLFLYARMIHSVMLIRVLLHAVASSHITKCHFCCLFALVAVVFINELFVRKKPCSRNIHMFIVYSNAAVFDFKML